MLPENIKIPPSGTFTIEFNGRKVLLNTNQTSYLTQLLYWKGPSKFEYTDIFLELIKDIQCFYDVGANIGYYSLLATAQNSKIEAICFEPAAGPLFFLRENVRINRLNNIRIESIALSDKSGEIDFYEVKNDKYEYLKYNLAGEGNTGSKRTSRNFSKEVVKTCTLDEYASNKQDKTIELIKLDTEGTEDLILENAKGVVSKMKPIIICETLFGKIEDKLERIMKDHGYDFYNHLTTGLQKVDSICRTKDNGIRNCFFVHPSKSDLIEKFIPR